MDETAIAACDRIDAALTRLQTALAAGPDRDLSRRHELLREAAASSLLTIDALIAAHEATDRAPDRT